MFTLTTTPTELTVTVDGQTVACTHVVVEAALGQAPRVTLVPLDGVTVDGEGITQVVTPPTPAQIDTAALEALAGIDKTQFEAHCKTKLQQGARDPFQVALDVIKEMAGG